MTQENQHKVIGLKLLGTMKGFREYKSGKNGPRLMLTFIIWWLIFCDPEQLYGVLFNRS